MFNAIKNESAQARDMHPKDLMPILWFAGWLLSLLIIGISSHLWGYSRGYNDRELQSRIEATKQLSVIAEKMNPALFQQGVMPSPTPEPPNPLAPVLQN